MKHLFLLIILLPLVSCAGEFGKFTGTVKVEWLRSKTNADREMRLIEEFKYKDPNGVVWTVPAGSIINGASIPRVLWFLGSPFIGNYREASVVHDYFYHQNDFTRKSVDKMFFNACRAGGLTAADAGAMYFTLRTKDQFHAPKPDFGPAMASAEPRILQSSEQVVITDSVQGQPEIARSAEPEQSSTVIRPQANVANTIENEEISNEEVLAIREWIKNNNPTLEEIEAAANQRLIPRSQP